MGTFLQGLDIGPELIPSNVLWRHGEPKKPAPADLRSVREVEELLTRTGIIANNAEQAAGDQSGPERVDSAQRHTAVLGFNHHAYALRLENILDGLGDLGGKIDAAPLLDDGMPGLPAQISMYNRTRAAHHAFGARTCARGRATTSR